MKFSIIALAAAVTCVSAVEFPGQPACASPCISQAITQGSNCNIEDVACQCQSSNLAAISTAVVPCILSACTGAGELQQASEAGPSQCASLAANAGATTGASSTSSEASSTESSTSSAEPGSSTSSGPASTTASGTGTSAPTTTSQAGGGGGGGSNTSVTTSPPSSSTVGQVTQNAAQSVGLAGVGGIVGLFAAVVAAL